MRIRCRGAILAGAVLVLGAAGSAAAQSPTESPFTATSPWNTALGGAQFGSPTCDNSLHLENLNSGTVNGNSSNPGAPYINAEKFSFPMFQSTLTDPLEHIYKVLSNGTKVDMGQYHIPATATPDTGSDHSLVVFEPSGTAADEMWLADTSSGTEVDAGNMAQSDLVNGDGFSGVRASHASVLGGLIRTWEIQAGSIRHKLAIALTQSVMSPTFVPPAKAIDGNHSGYHGTIPMGQLFAIPPDVDVNSLGLTSSVGRMIATALKAYGGYVVDTGGNFALYAEPGAAPLVDPARNTHGQIRPPWTNASDLGRIVNALRCVSG